MLDAVPERTAALVVESSANSDRYMPAVVDAISRLLQDKAAGSAPFEFTVAHFSRDIAFWDTELVTCTVNTAAAASTWMRSWQSTDYSSTPRRGLHSARGSLSSHPCTLAAIIQALESARVQAVYLAAASAAAVSTNDLLQHVRLSSKGRPVHVIFMTRHGEVDYASMEQLRLIAKETGGTFRTAYFNSLGMLIEIARDTKTTDSWLTRQQPAVRNDMERAIASFPLNTLQRDQRVQLAEWYNERLHPANNQSSDITIPLSTRPGDSQFRDVKISLSIGDDLAAALGHGTKRPLTRPKISHTLPIGDDPLLEENEDDEKMDEVRRMFRKLYAQRTRRASRSKGRSSLKKSLSARMRRSARLARTSSDSSSSSSSSSSLAGSLSAGSDNFWNAAEAHSDEVVARYKRKYGGGNSGYLNRRKPSWRRVGGGFVDASSPRLPSYGHRRRTSSPGVTAQRPPWRGATSAGTTNSMATRRHMAAYNAKTDRTTWMDPQKTAALMRENAIRQMHGKRTTAVQAGGDTNTTPWRQRLNAAMGKALNARTDKHHGSQTQERHSAREEAINAHAETIRQLVDQNSQLLNEIRTGRVSSGRAPQPFAHSDRDRVERNRVAVWKRINTARSNDGRLHHNQTGGLNDWRAVKAQAEVKRAVNDEIKALATGLPNGTVSTRHFLNNQQSTTLPLNGHVRSEPRGIAFFAPLPPTSTGRKQTRPDGGRSTWIHNQTDRYEGLKRQNQQESYRKMYEKLVSDASRQNVSAQT